MGPQTPRLRALGLGLSALPLLFACLCTPVSPSSGSPTFTPLEPTRAASDTPLAPLGSPPPIPSPTSTAPPRASSLPDASSADWQLVHEGLLSPVDLQADGSGRIFLVEQRGVILLTAGGQVQPTPYLDIQDRVNSSFNEQGLLGLAFHPRFLENGALYVNYTGSGGNTFISRFQANPLDATVDRSSESIVLTFDQPFPNHNGGGMVFGPDGFLYISSGDGGAAGDPFGNGQSRDTLLGKILRIDVDGGSPYGIPSDNPFAAGGGRAEIWDLGLRNPWRFSFDPATGDLFIGDVGQDDWEEIDFKRAGSAGGLNYGWNLREGLHRFAGGLELDFVEPVAEYSHELGCSVTGGVVVRDPALPAWQGVYLYADYCSGIVWGLLETPQGVWENEILFRTELRPSSFGVDAEQHVYLIDRQGRIFRLTAAP